MEVAIYRYRYGFLSIIIKERNLRGIFRELFSPKHSFHIFVVYLVGSRFPPHSPWLST